MARTRKVSSTGMKKAKEKIDDSDQRRLRRFLFLWLPIIVGVLAFVYAISFDPVNQASGKQMEAILVGISESPPADGVNRQLYTVRFADGQLITLPIEKEGIFRKGRRILVEAKETTLFKRKIYEFVRFLD